MKRVVRLRQFFNLKKSILNAKKFCLRLNSLVMYDIKSQTKTFQRKNHYFMQYIYLLKAKNRLKNLQMTGKQQETRVINSKRSG